MELNKKITNKGIYFGRLWGYFVSTSKDDEYTIIKYIVEIENEKENYEIPFIFKIDNDIQREVVTDKVNKINMELFNAYETLRIKEVIEENDFNIPVKIIALKNSKDFLTFKIKKDVSVAPNQK